MIDMVILSRVVVDFRFWYMTSLFNVILHIKTLLRIAGHLSIKMQNEWKGICLQQR